MQTLWKKLFFPKGLWKQLSECGRKVDTVTCPPRGSDGTALPDSDLVGTSVRVSGSNGAAVL